jgi:TRAP-type mannitol/chloroaromatic compound transport system substrate-binding protein
MTDRKKIDRRKFLTGVGAVVAGAAVSSPAIAKGVIEWKMVMSWPKTLPGLGTGAVRLAKRITKMSEGRLMVKAYGAGDLVPALQVFDAVSQGTAEMGHTAPYYWLNKSRSSAFFCTIPGGLTAKEQNAWLYFGGGQKLWDELYAQFGLRSFAAGNTGTQMGGWFNREINGVEDLKGLKMRMPGLGGEVLNRLGGSAQNIPAAELYTSLQQGLIDAVEWVGPWNDLALGFHDVAKYYYGPGFHEGGPTLELMVNKKAFDALPKHLQTIVKTACATENILMEAEYYRNNLVSYQALKHEHKVDVRVFPDAVLKKFYEVSEEVAAETAEAGDLEKRIFESYHKFRKASIEMAPVSEYGFMRARNGL